MPVADLRLITMLQSLELLLTLGKCREMPVMGFVGDVPVMGIIVSFLDPSTAHIRTKSFASQLSKWTIARIAKPRSPTFSAEAELERTVSWSAIPRRGRAGLCRG